jgi:predicted DsbA family dithiol-disulfide isomerase
MKVEIWSDVVCPFCYIGKHHFEKAMDAFPNETIDVEWKSFELDPYAQKDYEDDLYTLLANKYGQTREWAIRSAEQMKQKGKQIGLEFNFDISVSTNSFDAHRLLHLAKSKDKQIEAEEMLFEKYFKEGQHIGHHDVLEEIGQNLGIDKDEISAVLESNQFSEDVRSDEKRAQELGIRGVPYFVINNKHGISGAQPVEHFTEVLKKAIDEESEIVHENKNSGDSCDADGCD